MATARLTSSVERDGKMTRRWLVLDADSDIRVPAPIFFEFDSEPPRNFDGLVLAVLFWAMAARVDLDVRGPMTPDAIANIDELQTALARIHGPQYQPVRIMAQTVEPSCEGPPTAAISLFSGGADATFTLLRHQGGGLGAKALPISSVLMVHHEGLAQPDRVDKRLERTRPFLDAMGVDVRVLRSNLRAETDRGVLGPHGQKWAPSYCGQLAASLHQYGNEFGRGLFGSTDPYDRLELTTGSTPATDWMLSNGKMRILHSGAGFSRTEKIALIGKHPEARRCLHVCWEHPYENCGECAKCVRTYLNFLACGIEQPECMPGRLNLSQIDRLPLKRGSRGHGYTELETILDSARKNGAVGPWVGRLEDRLTASHRVLSGSAIARFSRNLGRSLAKRSKNRLLRA